MEIVLKYVCGFCDLNMQFNKKLEMKKHEASCGKNPANKKCPSCEHETWRTVNGETEPECDKGVDDDDPKLFHAIRSGKKKCPKWECKEGITLNESSTVLLGLIGDLPLGTRFKYKGGRDIWVLLQDFGFGLAARWQGVDGPVAGQTVCSIVEKEEELKTLEVEVLG